MKQKLLRTFGLTVKTPSVEQKMSRGKYEDFAN